jgi:uncharacterized protein
MADWSFYGRDVPLAELRKILGSPRWFFCRISGRRRIGKTTLLRELARADVRLGNSLLYLQVPDSDERDVATSFRRQMEESEFKGAAERAAEVTDFLTMAKAIGWACRAGMVVVLDEFQYFTRAKMTSFNSFLQAEVDALRNENLKEGGLFVLGSLQSEMNALLDDKGAPLYGRITNKLELDHWDFGDLLEVFSSQGVNAPSQWLTLWTFFEGVPKFYHDAYVQGLYEVGPEQFSEQLLSRMFMGSSSPLSEEADTWFLRELRGKGVSILNYLSGHPGSTHGDLTGALKDPHDSSGLQAAIARLVNSYMMVDKRLPVFAESNSRSARYYVADNFLQAWLAVAKPARETARLRPVERALTLAMPRLQTLEGHMFEKLIRKLHVECSQKGVGDLELSSMNLGYWNRARNVDQAVEIDLVALDETNKTIRFGSCKRSATSHDGPSLVMFDKHIEGFLTAREFRYLRDWKQERFLFSPVFEDGQRKTLEAKGLTCRDLNDFARTLASKATSGAPAAVVGGRGV